MKQLQRLLREPLLHFFAIGALIFLLYAAVSDTGKTLADVIVITPERIDQLSARFTSVWKRQPTEKELESIIKEDVREEVYYREALSLGLDKNDAIVRRRLRQKMEFFSDAGATLLKPAAGELEDYLAANEKSYRSAPKLAFEQVYLGENPTPQTMTQSLSTLQANPAGNTSDMGERTLLPAQLKLSSQQAVEGVFGKGFFEQLAKLPSGVWRGPVTSTYGVHLVRILETAPARNPPLDEVRDKVLRDWKAVKVKEIREKDYARRLERYSVEIHRGDAKKTGSK